MCATNTVLPGGYVILACCQKVEMMLSKTAIIFIWFHLYFTLHLFRSGIKVLHTLRNFFFNILKGIPLKSRLKSNHLAYYDDLGKLRAFPPCINNTTWKKNIHAYTHSFTSQPTNKSTKRNKKNYNPFEKKAKRIISSYYIFSYFHLVRAYRLLSIQTVLFLFNFAFSWSSFRIHTSLNWCF